MQYCQGAPQWQQLHNNPIGQGYVQSGEQWQYGNYNIVMKILYLYICN